MKLDLNCIRYILMDIEGLSDGRHNICISESNYKQLFERCKKYDYDVLNYHLKQCQMNDYFAIIPNSKTFDDDFVIFDLSPKGHDTLAKIRDENVWKKVLRVVQGLTSFSISLLTPIAESVIKQNLGLM